MPGRPAMLGLLASGLLASAQPAFAGLMKDAGACLDADDRPLCLLHAIAVRDGKLLRQDADLWKRPDLLRAVGVDPGGDPPISAADEQEKLLSGPLPDSSRIFHLSIAGRFEEAAQVSRSTDAALDKLAFARLTLMNAALAAGRDDIAREVADTMLAMDLRSAFAPFQTPEKVLVAASPSAREQWLTRREAELRPATAETAGSETWHATVVLRGWRAIRPEHAEAVYERLRPWALAEVRAWDPDTFRPSTSLAQALLTYLLDQDRVSEALPFAVISPAPLLRNDMVRGRGVTNLDGYLASTRNEFERKALVWECSRIAADVGAFEAGEACLERWRAEAEPHEIASLVSDSLQLASAAAQADSLELALRLLRMASAISPADDPWPELFAGSKRTALRDIAKAELRADGRLPPQ